ncbi:MAG TPA: MFS transporter [Bryobacteraceae bacterium]
MRRQTGATAHVQPMIVTEHSIRYPGWRITIAASACLFVSFGSLFVYTFGVFLKPLALEFHWTREAVSAAFGFAALSVAACSPPLGVLLDRFPVRRITLPSIFVFGSAFGSLSLLTGRLWHLYAVFVLLGIVGNGTAHLAFSRPLSTWFETRRGGAFAVLLAGGALGAMVLPPFAQWLIEVAGWRKAFAILGGIVLLVGLPLASRVRERWPIRSGGQPTVAGVSVADGVRSRIFWIIVTMLFLCSVSQNGAITHLPALLSDRGIPAGKATLAVSALGAATLGGRLFTGWLLDRCFAPRIAFYVLAVAALGTLILSSTRSLFTGILGAACVGIGMGGEADITPYLLSKYFGLRSFSTLYGFTWTAYAVAAAIGPIIMGKAFDVTGSYRVLLIGLALSTLLAAALMLLLPRYSSGSTNGQISAIGLARSTQKSIAE